MKDKYVAYVSTYTMGTLTNDKKSYGIKIYDVDLKNGCFTPKDQVEITNSSYVTISHNKKYLYSITDMGVESYRIEKEGTLTRINQGSINGMRGCYLSTDYEDKFLFTAGYHDGKITALRLNEDGGIGDITDEIFCKGMGSMAERTSRPHVSCVKMTRDNKFLCAADLGMDHVNVYLLDHMTGRLKLVDILRSDQDSAPRHIKFSQDGKFLYIVHELKNFIDVYTYKEERNIPDFEKIQTISTVNEYHASNSAASALNISEDFRYIVTSNAGDNTVAIYKVDKKTGMLEKLLCLPISGDYPKTLGIFPDGKYFVSLNHDTDEIILFAVDYEKKHFLMKGRPIRIETPNCIHIHKLTEQGLSSQES